MNGLWGLAPLTQVMIRWRLWISLRSAVVKAKIFPEGPTGDLADRSCNVKSLGWRGWWYFIFPFLKVARKGQNSNPLQRLRCAARGPSCLRERWTWCSEAAGVQVTPVSRSGCLTPSESLVSHSFVRHKTQAGFLHCSVQVAQLLSLCKCDSGDSVYLSQKYLPGKLIVSFSCWSCGPLGLVCCPVSQAAQLAGIFLAPLHV